MRPPRLRCTLFPLIYPPHLLVLPATLGLHLFWQTYPYFRALYVISVRRTKSLLTASFRFHLTMDTLAVLLYTSSLPRRVRDFHPLERAHGAQTKTRLSRDRRIDFCGLSCRSRNRALNVPAVTEAAFLIAKSAPARSGRNIRCSDFLHNKTSPAFSVSVSARLRQICVTSGSAESAGSVCRRAPPRLCPAGAPFLRSWSSACSCSCPARTERNKYFSYSSAFQYS